MRIIPGFLICCLLLSCSNYGQLNYITKLPKKLRENSGIAIAGDSTLWFIEDNNNPDELYLVNYKGDLLAEIEIDNAKNDDWEDLAKDREGNLYIADIGNNDNNRKDLMVYKITPPENTATKKIKAKVIAFDYPEQEDFPPDREKRLYDAEALVYSEGNLYIFTKNRANPFTGASLVYQVPAKPGKYEAKLVGEFTPCDDPRTCQVTAADISPDGKTLALLGYGKLWLVRDYSLDKFEAKNIETIDLGMRSQLESVCFKSNTLLLLSDEGTGPHGRNLYSYSIKSP